MIEPPMSSVLILSRFTRLGASSRLRHLQFIPLLESYGFKITVQALLPDEYLIGLYRAGKRSKLRVLLACLRRLLFLLDPRSAPCGLLVIEKELFPFVPAWIERWLLRPRPIIVDYDDATFHSYDLNSNRIVRMLLGKKIDRLMASADAVTVGSCYLAERATAAGAKSVVLLPTVVDIDRYALNLTAAPKGLGDEPLTTTIGWCGTPMTLTYLLLLKSALRELAKARKIKLLIVGAKNVSVPGVEVECVPWTEDSEVEQIRRFDIGVMPLADGPWERGKCGYKLIQFMALAKPVVASKVGANCDIVVDGLSGFLATTEDEWIESLRRLVDNGKMRDAMGQTGRRIVEERYSTRVIVPQIATLWASIVDGGIRRTIDNAEDLRSEPIEYRS